MVFRVYPKYFTEPSWVVCFPAEEENSKRRKYHRGAHRVLHQQENVMQLKCSDENPSKQLHHR